MGSGNPTGESQASTDNTMCGRFGTTHPKMLLETNTTARIHQKKTCLHMNKHVGLPELSFVTKKTTRLQTTFKWSNVFPNCKTGKQSKCMGKLSLQLLNLIQTMCAWCWPHLFGTHLYSELTRQKKRCLLERLKTRTFLQKIE